jgi:hypothetical protein
MKQLLRQKHTAFHKQFEAAIDKALMILSGLYQWLLFVL